MGIEIKRSKINRKAQVTIFIILALIIVVAIALVFVLMRKPTVEISASTDPEAYVERCIKDYVEETINILSEQGGDIVPEGSVMYQGKDITYLCYNANFYSPCVNQRPLLIEHIEDEITKYLDEKMKDCFSSLRDELEKRNYDVSLGSMSIETKLQSKRVTVTVNRKTEISKGQDVRKFEEFREAISHPIYDLAEIAMEIANQEARYCYFDVLGFMILYPNYDINKFDLEKGTIYTIKDLTTNKKFTFAIRSCAMPPGF